MEPKTPIEKQIVFWTGIAPPNAQAREMAAQLEALIKDFEAQQGLLAFEDEPSSFEAALQATKDRE